eukprot:scaffold5651_cov108-Isochrysis_galbana.AAC.3
MYNRLSAYRSNASDTDTAPSKWTTLQMETTVLAPQPPLRPAALCASLKSLRRMSATSVLSPRSRASATARCSRANVFRSSTVLLWSRNSNGKRPMRQPTKQPVAEPMVAARLPSRECCCSCVNPCSGMPSLSASCSTMFPAPTPTTSDTALPMPAAANVETWNVTPMVESMRSPAMIMMALSMMPKAMNGMARASPKRARPLILAEESWAEPPE